MEGSGIRERWVREGWTGFENATRKELCVYWRLPRKVVDILAPKQFECQARFVNCQHKVETLPYMSLSTVIVAFNAQLLRRTRLQP
jgi:hypothetical protein